MKKVIMFFILFLAGIGMTGCGKASPSIKMPIDVADYFYWLDRKDVNLNFVVTEYEYGKGDRANNVSYFKAVAEGTPEELQLLKDRMLEAGYLGSESETQNNVFSFCYSEDLPGYVDPEDGICGDPLEEYIDFYETKVEFTFFSKRGNTHYYENINPGQVIVKNKDLNYDEITDILFFKPSEIKAGAYDVCIWGKIDLENDEMQILDTVECPMNEIRDLYEISVPGDGKMVLHRKKGTNIQEAEIIYKVEKYKTGFKYTKE